MPYACQGNASTLLSSRSDDEEPVEEAGILDACGVSDSCDVWPLLTAVAGSNLVIPLHHNDKHAWAARTTGRDVRDSSRFHRRRCGWACKPAPEALQHQLLPWQLGLNDNRKTFSSRLGAYRTSAIGLTPSSDALSCAASAEPSQHRAQATGAQSAASARPGPIRQQRRHSRRQSTSALPYSVPTLAVGDVFLSCNTVAGLQPQDDLDDWLTGSVGSSILPPSDIRHHSSPALRQPVAALDPASELLLRMSPPLGGQRLMFVSQEAAEVVRRAMLLNRYTEIMQQRAAVTSPGTASRNPSSESRSPSGCKASPAEDASGNSTGITPAGSNTASTNSTGSCNSSTTSRGCTSIDGRPAIAIGLSGRLRDTLAALGANLGHGPSPGTADSGSGGKTDRFAAAVGVSGDGPAGASLPSASIMLKRLSGAVDVTSGPRPRLPAAPLLSPIPLPQHVVTPLAAGLQALTEEGSGPVAGDAAEASTHGGPVAGSSGPAGSAGDGAEGGTAEHKAVGGAAAAAERLPHNTDGLLRELKELEEQRVIADAQALLQAGKARRSALGGGDGGSGSDGFLPPFSFSSYVARLPLQSALKALIASSQTPSPAAAVFAASPSSTHNASSCTTDTVGMAADDPELPASALSQRRFVLVPDAADEQAAHASRVMDETVWEAQEELAAALRDEVTSLGSDGAPGYGTRTPGGRGRLRQRPAGKDDYEGSKRGIQGDVDVDRDPRQPSFDPTRVPRPRLALNLYDSDSGHWVLDSIDDNDQEEETDGAVESAPSLDRRHQRPSGSSSGQAQSSEHFIRGAPSGPEDVEHLLQPSDTSLNSSTSAALDARPTARTATGAIAAPLAMATLATGPPGDDSDSDSTPPGRTPVFLLPGVTLSVRSADGTLLRLRPAFLSLQQLATALTLARDAAVVVWRRQRSEQRWKVVSALDVLTVHFAGFPILKFPSMPPSGATGGGGAGGGDDEDSDDGIPEAKELLREMGAGARRPASSATAMSSGRGLQSPPSGPLAVFATMAVGVVSFGAWCLAAAGDVWDDLHTRTHWGLKHVGLPQHVNVKPTYLEDQMVQLAAGNTSAVAAAVAARTKAAKQRRARRRQQAAERQAAEDQQQPPQVTAEQRKDPEAECPGEGNQQHQQEGPAHGIGMEGMEKGEWEQERGPPGAAGGPWGEHEDGEEVVSCRENEEHRREGRQASDCAAPLVGPDGGSDAASEAATAAGMLAGIAATDSSSTAAAVSDATLPEETATQGADPAPAQLASAQNSQNRKNHHHRGASAGGRFVLDLPPETVTGLALLTQLTWAVARAAQVHVNRVASGGIGGGLDVGPGGAAAVGMDMLMRVAVGGGAGVSGGGNGVTFATNGAGELGFTARMEVKPTPASSWGAAGKAKAGSSAATPEETAGAGAGSDGPAGVAGDPSTGSESAGAGATAGMAEGSARVRGGISVHNLGTWGRAARKLEVQHSAYKLPLQMKQPFSFEASLHINNRKLVGDVPYDAPDELLPRLQPAGPTPLLPATASPTPVTTGAMHAPAVRRGSQGPEAHGMILIGDLGLDVGGVYDDQASGPPAIGFVDLGGLLPVGIGAVPTAAGSHPVTFKESPADQAVQARAEAAGPAAGHAMEEDGWYPRGVGCEVELGGASRSGLGIGGSWAASGRGSGSWGRWGR